MGCRFDSLVAPESRERVVKYHLDRAIGRPAPTRYQFRIVTKDGRMREAEAEVAPIEWEGEIVQQAVIHDITEKKVLEQRLLEEQKMDSIGILAGGVAHEFNNLLALIGPNAQLIEHEAKGLETVVRRSRVIRQAVKRATHLTRQLLSLAARSRTAKLPFSPNQALVELVDLLRESLIGPLVFELELDPQAGWVAFDAPQFDQIIINLALNSRDAMPNGGTIRIATYRENRPVDPLLAPTKAADTAEIPHTVIRFSDTGFGIPPEALPNIYDPFYTTKEPGAGTGLGLSVVYGIVRDHQGWIHVESKVGEGTSFYLAFPMIDPPIS